MRSTILSISLAESLFATTILLQDYIAFEEISYFEVRATITYGGQTAELLQERMGVLNLYHGLQFVVIISDVEYEYAEIGYWLNSS